jgi:hypothetical protein
MVQVRDLLVEIQLHACLDVRLGEQVHVRIQQLDPHVVDAGRQLIGEAFAVRAVVHIDFLVVGDVGVGIGRDADVDAIGRARCSVLRLAGEQGPPDPELTRTRRLRVGWRRRRRIGWRRRIVVVVIADDDTASAELGDNAADQACENEVLHCQSSHGFEQFPDPLPIACQTGAPHRRGRAGRYVSHVFGQAARCYHEPPIRTVRPAHRQMAGAGPGRRGSSGPR